MKRFISQLLTFFILFWNLSFFTFDTVKAWNENKFIVSAYYSPLPNQKYYFKWSYEADVKLNWKWIRWASWKEVYPWMIAAPKSYMFWLKIYLEWVWIVEVADRWWAIVSTDKKESRWYNYDRLDIWMWYGEEWLARALSFGKKEVAWYVLEDSSTPVSINITSIPAPLNILSKYEVKQDKVIIVNKSQEIENKLISNFTINKEKPDIESVKKLQTIFKEIWIYKWLIDWKYETIQKELITYQVYRKIIPNKNSIEAWHFWQKTLNQLNKDYALSIEKKLDQKKEKEKLEKQMLAIKTTVDNKIKNHFQNIWTPKVWDVWENVRNLQKTLKTLWYFKQKDTAIFWETTKDSLIKYQLDKNIIKSKNDSWAWVFWPKTKEVSSQELAIILETQLLKEQNLLSYKK